MPARTHEQRAQMERQDYAKNLTRHGAKNLEGTDDDRGRTGRTEKDGTKLAQCLCVENSDL